MNAITFTPTRTFVDPCGYVVAVSGRTVKRVHRIVWEAAYGSIPPGQHVHHRNGDKRDNRLKNLEFLSASEHLSRHADAFRVKAKSQLRDDRGRFVLAA